jgi:hypothetical protein
VEFHFALGPKHRRADRTAKIEIEAGGRPVRRLADQSRARDGPAADDARRLDALEDRAGMGGEGSSKAKSENGAK